VSATVGSDSKAAIAQRLGADHTIRYKHESVEQYVERLTTGEGFDAVFDTVGGANIAASIHAAKLNGQVACIQGRGAVDGGPLHARAVSLHLVFMLIPLLHDLDRSRHGHILERITQLVDAGKVQPLIDARRFTLDGIGDAHAYAESGDQIGKVLVVHPDHA
ncbi:MAG: zinc-binding dehydrogenase, partial [Phycisphaeraceae bacterium]